MTLLPVGWQTSERAIGATIPVVKIESEVIVSGAGTVSEVLPQTFKMNAKLKIAALLSCMGVVLVLGLVIVSSTHANAVTAVAPDPPDYGENDSAGHSVELDGISLYYETYGKGAPLLLLHGNGGDISSMGDQLDFFSNHYQVIAPDSRGHGKSEMGPGRLTYRQMAEDMNALLDKLGLKKVDVLGWSDGGIVGLLLAINHPDKVDKLAIMGANIEPGGLYDWESSSIKKQLEEVDAQIANGDTSEPWDVYHQQLSLMVSQPHIPLEKLKGITSPTLVMAADKDVVRDDHTQSIFNALPNAHLCIFPGATHMIPMEDPELFNQTVERFFSKPFTRPDTKTLIEGTGE